MGLKVFMWNLENFGVDGITSLGTSKLQDQTDVAAELVKQANADILVVVEVLGSDPYPKYKKFAGYRGTIISGNAADGTRTILQLLRDNDSTKWCLIPPRNLNTQDRFLERGNEEFSLNSSSTNEAIAVFYRSDKVEFAGPYYNAKGNIGKLKSPDVEFYSTVRKLQSDAVAYATPWDNCLPQGNEYAGYVLPLDNNPNVKYPPQCNMPFLARFKNLTSVAKEEFDLISFHASRAQQNGGRDGKGLKDKASSALLDGIKNCAFPVKNPVIIGDFNANVDPIRKGGYTSAIESTTVKGQASSTMLGKAYPDDAYLYGQYPGYNYLKSQDTDNILINPYWQFVADSVTICNPVVGYPYQKGLPIAGLRFRSYLAATNEDLADEAKCGDNLIKTYKNTRNLNTGEAFMKAGWAVFRDVSDHLPLFAEIEKASG